VWTLPSEIHEVQADAVERLGYKHRFVLFDGAIPDGTDIVLAQGPFGTLWPVIHQLVGQPLARRPVFAYWFEENLNMETPPLPRRLLAQSFSELSWRYRESVGLCGRAGRPLAGLLAKKAVGLGYLGDILWLHSRGLLDVLALSSTVYAAYLANLGIESLLVPRGYHPGWGETLNLRRDVAVVWMGKVRGRRRRRAIPWLQGELTKRGQAMEVYDGFAKPFVFGRERTEILNRTHFVLNIYERPWHELSIRHFVAAANGAVVLTEPGENRYPFVPGEHIVECRLEMMPDAVMHYLTHEDEWGAISKNVFELVTSKLTLMRSIKSILTAAEAVLAARRTPPLRV